ncbi:hypothetical protein FOMG_17693 [Fusarium oxysporum f. sp. melonis 26406]|uniref:Zn(2)-C6 fungal-type domain-containing protein n=1 Tax=Fusarium oxysporum f. sp. melonis 26406 TaxID=1089452 RepID=W9ZX58_FUSOX|nr:hypothetical protein FOMG_17693 [Fusarium oxysporum f. sp. melonis 26406]
MPIKRPHKKSRNGCDTCRRRRVKCDERFPRCGICSNRGEDCTFTRRAINPIASTTSPETAYLPTIGSPVSTSEACQEADASSVCVRQLRTKQDLSELSLMHHWCTKAYRVTATEHAEILLQDTVNEGFRHAYLLDIVFALTSFHLATDSHDEVDAERHVKIALQYQSRSVIEMGKVLQEVNGDSCNAIVMASILNLFCTLVCPLLESAPDNKAGLAANAILGVTRYFRGIGFLMEQNMNSIKQGPFAKIFGEPSTVQPGPPTGDSAEDLQRLRRWMLMRIAPEHPLLGVFSDELESLEHILTKTHGRSVFEWIARARVDFFQALKQGEEAAIAITMYWAVLTNRLEGTWWAEYAGRRIVEDLSSQHNDFTNGWKELCQWCRHQVGVIDADDEGQDV